MINGVTATPSYTYYLDYIALMFGKIKSDSFEFRVAAHSVLLLVLVLIDE